MQNTVLESRFRSYPILDENERVVGTLSRFHLLSRLHLGDIDSGDLLLLLILFFLFREEADEEVLIAIGLLLIL